MQSDQNAGFPNEAPDLTGRIALVTGSGRNIGRAVALAFARAGADVAVHARSSRDEVEAVAAEARRAGVRAIALLGDVRDEDAMADVIGETRAQLGPVDLLVNSAADRPEGPFDEMSFDQWRGVLGTIVDGAFICTRGVIGDMLTLGSGTIINMIGLTGQSGAPNRAHVVSAKSALIGFTKALALEYAGRGITVNGVSPGVIAADEQPGGPRRPEPIHRQNRVIPVGRQGRPDDIAAMCCFLASQHARYVTGQIFAVNGGTYL